MRMLAKALTTLTVAVGAVAMTATPAAASHQCDATDQLCVITTGTTIPVGTPATGPLGSPSFRIPLANLCLPTCQTVYLVVPGAVVSSSGTTIAEITLPEYGVRVDSAGFPWIYGGVPTVNSGGTPGSLGLTLFVQVPWIPVVTDNMSCVESIPINVGPATAWMSGDCMVNVDVVL